MLKLILLDVNPYLIDGKYISDETWKTLEEKNIIDGFINKNNSLEPLLKKNKSLFNSQDEYLQVVDVKIYDEIVDEWNKTYSAILHDYMIKKEVNQAIFKLIQEAENNNVKIVFVTNNSNFENLGELFNQFYKEKRIDILKLNNFQNLTTQFVIDYASGLNVSYEEIAVVTQQEETINDLSSNAIFTITVNGNNEVVSDCFITLESYDEINIDQILYFYHEYEKCNNCNI